MRIPTRTILCQVLTFARSLRNDPTGQIIFMESPEAANWDYRNMTGLLWRDLTEDGKIDAGLQLAQLQMQGPFHLGRFQTATSLCDRQASWIRVPEPSEAIRTLDKTGNIALIEEDGRGFEETCQTLNSIAAGEAPMMQSCCCFSPSGFEEVSKQAIAQMARTHLSRLLALESQLYR